MDDHERRSLLHEVAAGRLSPDAAAARLRTGGSAADDDGGEEADDDRARQAGLARVRVEASAASVRITGDRTVHEAVVDGRHRLHREGDTLVVEPEHDDNDEPVMRIVTGRGRWGRRGGLAPALRIRVNPALALDLGLHASSGWVHDVDGPISGEVSAGHLRIGRFRGPLQLAVNAGSLDGEGILTDGDSRVTCDAGRVRLRLDPASSVRISAHVNLGRLEIHTPERPDGGSGLVVGDGRATLAVEGNLAKVEIDAR